MKGNKRVSYRFAAYLILGGIPSWFWSGNFAAFVSHRGAETTWLGAYLFLLTIGFYVSFVRLKEVSWNKQLPGFLLYTLANPVFTFFVSIFAELAVIAVIGTENTSAELLVFAVAYLLTNCLVVLADLAARNRINQQKTRDASP